VVKTESKNDRNEKKNEHQLLEAERKGKNNKNAPSEKTLYPKYL